MREACTDGLIGGLRKLARFYERRPPGSPIGRRSFPVVYWGLLAGVGLLVATEAGLRVRERYLYGSFSRAGTTLFTPESGTMLNKPGASIEGSRLRVHVNAMGFRGREIVIPKPVGTFRVVCIGGSTTFDTYATTDEDTWPGRLERLLRDKHPQVEVVNAGVPSHTLATSLGPAIWPKIESIQPDLLVVYHASNEISELARATFGAQTATQTRKPIAKFLTDWSLLAFKLALVADRIAPRVESFGTGELPDTGVRAFEASLRELVHRAQRNHVGVALATVGVRWSEDAPLEKRNDLLRGAAKDFVGLSPEGIARAFRSYNSTIERVAHELGAVLLPVATSVTGREECFGDMTHQSPEGSSVIAAVIATGLERAGVISP